MLPKTTIAMYSQEGDIIANMNVEASLTQDEIEHIHNRSGAAATRATVTEDSGSIHYIYVRIKGSGCASPDYLKCANCSYQAAISDQNEQYPGVIMVPAHNRSRPRLAGSTFADVAQNHVNMFFSSSPSPLPQP